ncbi:MAG: glycerol-3-phosphate acyltransferase, partial [Anaerotignum sp.]
MFRLICLCIGYCIGCIETAYVVGRLWRVDLRQHGSGNLGTTNALRVLGKKAGALVFIGDILKSVIAFLICRAIFKDHATIAGLFGSVGAVLGHNYPFYLHFKGGKGIAVMIGMTAALAFTTDIRLAVPNALIGFGMAFATGYVSVGSLLF